MVTALLVSIVITPSLVFTAEPVMMLMGAGDKVKDCLAYGVPICISTFLTILSGVMSRMLRGEGAAMRSIVIQAVGAAMNIIWTVS